MEGSFARLWLVTVVCSAILACGKTVTYRITDAGDVYSTINTSDCLQWPDERTKAAGGASAWGPWHPETGDVGKLIGEARHCGTQRRVMILDVDGHVVPIDAASTEPP